MDFESLIKDMNVLMIFVVSIGLTFIFSGLGALTKEIYLMTVARSRKISLSRFFISMVSGGIASILISEYLKIKNMNIYFAISLISGMIGFEISMKITKLDFWTEIVEKIKGNRK